MLCTDSNVWFQFMFVLVSETSHPLTLHHTYVFWTAMINDNGINDYITSTNCRPDMRVASASVRLCAASLRVNELLVMKHQIEETKSMKYQRKELIITR